MVLQVLCVGLVLAFPGIAMWFPQWLKEGDRMAAPAAQQFDEPANTDSLEAGDRLDDRVDEPGLEK
jgi:hypothetical protein